MPKSIDEINEKIKRGQAVVVGADEMPKIVADDGLKRAAEYVDVVTTGTFGAMCSSGAFINFGHSDPPIKMSQVFLNDVEAYAGLAAVDAYIGATQLSTSKGMEYGGGHVIADLISGKEVSLRATSYGTDCYPLKSVDTTFTLEDLNQAYLFNPRNGYQRYVAATNSSASRIRTYMGTLLAGRGNVNFAGTGHISPLLNDPGYLSIGLGTKVFLGGTTGYVISEGTQHSPQTGFGTLALRADLAGMDPRFIRGCTIPEYGTSLMVGFGIPIPILNEELAKSTAITNDQIFTNLIDYSVARISRPTLKRVSYEELFSKRVELGGESIKSCPLSSMRISYEIMKEQKNWIDEGEFLFSKPINHLPDTNTVKPMKLAKGTILVKNAMTSNVFTAKIEQALKDVSKVLIEKEVDQLPVVDDSNKLIGIVTAFDFIRASASDKKRLSEVMTTKVITSTPDETIDAVSRRIQKHSINSTPVVDSEGRLVGIITLTDINKAYRGRR